MVSTAQETPTTPAATSAQPAVTNTAPADSSFAVNDRTALQQEYAPGVTIVPVLQVDSRTGMLIQNLDSQGRSTGPLRLNRDLETLRLERDLTPDLNHLATRYGNKDTKVEFRPRSSNAMVERFLNMEPADQQAVLSAPNRNAIQQQAFKSLVEAGNHRFHGVNTAPNSLHTYSARDLQSDIESYQRLLSVAANPKELEKIRGKIVEKFQNLDEHDSLRLCQNLRALHKSYTDGRHARCAESVLKEFLPKAEEQLKSKIPGRGDPDASAAYVKQVEEYNHQTQLQKYVRANPASIGEKTLPAIPPALESFGKNAELFNQFKKAGGDLKKLGTEFGAELLRNNPNGLDESWLKSLRELAKDQDDPTKANKWIDSFETAHRLALTDLSVIKKALAGATDSTVRNDLRNKIEQQLNTLPDGYDKTMKAIKLNEVIETHNRERPANKIDTIGISGDQSAFLTNHNLMREFASKKGDLSQLGADYLARLVTANPQGIDKNWLKQIEQLANKRGDDKPRLVEQFKQAYERAYTSALTNADVLRQVVESQLTDGQKNTLVGYASQRIKDLPYKERLTALKAIDGISNNGGALGELQNLLNDPIHATFLKGNRIVAEFGGLASLDESSSTATKARLREEIRSLNLNEDAAAEWVSELQNYASQQGISTQFSSFLNFYNECLKG